METKRKDILWFIILRLIIITSIIISTFLQFEASEHLIFLPLFYLIIAVYFLSFIYLILYHLGKYYVFQVQLQIFFDLLFITLLVYLAGGLRGSFYFLYIFEIIAASIVLSSRATYITAALSSVCFGILVDGMYLGVIPYFYSGQRAEYSFGFVLNNIFIAWGVFFLVAFLINHLTGSLRKTRKQLQIAEKELEIKKNLAVAGEFSAQLAHEIRNPLAAISGSIQVLRKEMKLSGEQNRLMDIVIDESQRASQSIEQFLNMASPSKETFSELNLSALMDETLTLMQRGGVLANKYRIEGNYKSAKLTYYGSKNQFKQIFWNLLKNGIKAMPDGGTLKIDFIKKGKDEISLVFSDNGSGMAKEEKDRLFEPFYSGFKEGKGIGLAIVHRIVDDYKGRIEAFSDPGRGTKIVIIFPWRSAAEFNK